MTKIKEDSRGGEWTKTVAYKNFESNLDHLCRVLKILSDDSTSTLSSITNLMKWVSCDFKKKSKENFDDLTSRLSDFASEFNEFVHLHSFLYAWMSVMLVTFIEAYMEENLEFIATKNPKLLNNTEPLSFDAVFESASLEDLNIELRQQWEKKTLRGGPARWLKRLHEMGARDYEKDCCFRMEHLWDTRNLIVHAQGVANKVYVKKYRHPKLKPGDPVRVAGNLFKWWLDGLKIFMEHTDRFFFKYAGRC